jgi:hypothetical protein
MRLRRRHGVVEIRMNSGRHMKAEQFPSILFSSFPSLASVADADSIDPVRGSTEGSEDNDGWRLQEPFFL